MTQEQAIERLKIKLDNDKKYLEQCNPFSDLVNEVRLDNKSIETVLSMLKEKDNRIKQLENMNKFQSKDIKETVDYTFELNKEIEEKDKIIQNMSKYILSLDIDKDICMKNTTNTELCNEDNSNCVECIIKHFSN